MDAITGARPLKTGYPDPISIRTQREIISDQGVKTSQIFLGNGSVKQFDLLFRAFC